MKIKCTNTKRCKSIMAAESTASTSPTIIVQSKAYVDITEDDYENGAASDIINQWDFDVRGEYNSIQELIQAIADRSYVFSTDINDYSFGDGAIRTSAMVNNENETPSEAEYDAWTHGEETLYIADMWLPLSVGSIHEMTSDEAEQFGIKDIW